FRNVDLLERHVTTHSGQLLLKPTISSGGQTEASDVVAKPLIMPTPKMETYACSVPGCYRVFTVKYTLMRHELWHRKEEARINDQEDDKTRREKEEKKAQQFDCTWPNCGAVFESRRELYTHRRVDH